MDRLAKPATSIAGTLVGAGIAGILVIAATAAPATADIMSISDILSDTLDKAATASAGTLFKTVLL